MNPNPDVLAVVVEGLRDAVSVFRQQAEGGGTVFVSEERREAWEEALKLGEWEVKRLDKGTGG